MSEQCKAPETDAQAQKLLLSRPRPSADVFLTFYFIKRGKGMKPSEAFNATMKAWIEVYSTEKKTNDAINN